MANPFDTFLSASTKKLWVHVIPTLLFRFFFFNLDAMGIRPSILSDTRHLPGHFRVRQSSSDSETITLNLRNVNRSVNTDASQLIAEISVEILEPFRKAASSLSSNTTTPSYKFFISGDSTKEWAKNLLTGSWSAPLRPDRWGLGN
jgi:hypothetical protein